MWHYGKTIRYVSAHVNTKWAHAIFKDIPGMTGWLKINAASSDGVTNVLDILTAAVADQRKVNVLIESNQVKSVYMS